MRGSPKVPMDLGDIVSAAFFLCVRRWRALLPMAAVSFLAALPLNLAFLMIAARQPNSGIHDPLPHWTIPLALLFVPAWFGVFYNQLALTRFALETWVGDRGRITSCYLTAARCFFSSLAAALITSVVLALGIATWIGAPVGLYFLVSWFFAGQVCLAEGEMHPLRLLGRSRSIVRGNWWRTAGVLAGIVLLAFLPSIAAGVIRTSSTIASVALSAVALAIAAPFLAAAQTMLYLDLRLRKHESVSLAPSGPAEPL